MIKKIKIGLYALLLLVYLAPALASAAEDVNLEDDLLSYSEPENHISDPLEPVNRVIFQFNDKVYFYLLNPVAKSWAYVVPQELRASLWSAFQNLLMPIRVVNDILQGRVAESGVELSRFVINSTIGVAGLGDPAKYVFKLESSDEDLGQTFGAYGAGEGMYLCLPFFGPSNIRDTIGLVGDSFLDPLNYMASDWPGTAAIHAGKRVNHTSLNLGEYEQFKEAAFDPYIAMREFYTRYRRKKINNRLNHIFGAKDDGNGKPAGLESQGMVVEASKDPVAPEHYYVQLGVFFDRDSMNGLHEKIVSIGEKTVVAKYQREDYVFYGLQVPAGLTFEDAKRVEKKMLLSGFKETTVVKHAAIAL